MAIQAVNRDNSVCERPLARRHVSILQGLGIPHLGRQNYSCKEFSTHTQLWRDQVLHRLCDHPRSRSNIEDSK